MTSMDRVVPHEEPIIVMERIAQYQTQRRLLPLPASNEQRNQAVAIEFGDGVERMSFEDDGYIFFGDSGETRIEEGISDELRGFNVFTQNPDVWVPVSMLDTIITYTMASKLVAKLNNSFLATDWLEVSVIGGRRVARVKPNVQIHDNRGKAVSTPDQPVDIIVPEEVPEKKTRPQFDINTIRPRFAEINLVNSRTPNRYGRITNIPAVNYLTEAKLVSYSKAHPDKTPPVPKHFVILDDERALKDAVPYERGPLPTYFMHQLIANYLDPISWVDVKGLVSPHIPQSQQRVQELAARLVLDRTVSARRDPSNGAIRLIRLNPMLFEDRR